MSDPTPSKTGGSANTPTSKSQTTLNPKAIVALVIVGVAGVFIFSNLDDQTVNWLFIQFTAPGWVLYALLFAGGLAVGFFLGRNRYKRQH